MRKCWWVLVLMLTGVFLVPAFAEEEASPPEEGVDGAAPADSGAAIYLPLKPAFVVNFGGPGHLKYLKVDVSVRLSESKAANAVRHHLPYIRNNLVMLFASQTDESVSSFKGKEALRQDCLAEIRKILLEEDGIEEGVVDVYFDMFIVQK